MRRSKLVIAALAVMVAIMAATAVPAMAANGVREERGESLQTQAAEENNNFNNGFVNDGFVFNPFFTTFFNPFVFNPFICFDNGTAFGCLNAG